MSHSLPIPGLKESSNLGLKGLAKPCHSHIGVWRPSKPSNMPKVKEQVDVSLHLCLVASPMFFDRSKKWIVKQIEPEPVSKTWVLAFHVGRGHSEG